MSHWKSFSIRQHVVSRPFFVWHFFVRRFSSRIFSSRIFLYRNFSSPKFSSGNFSYGYIFVWTIFRLYFFRSYIFSSVHFFVLYFFVRAFFRSYICSSVHIFVHAVLRPRRFRLSFFVHAVFRPCIFRLCHFSYMHSFLRTFFRPRSSVHELSHICVRGLRLWAPSSERCRLYVVGRASRPSTAPIPSATTCDCGRSAARGGGRLAGRPAGVSVRVGRGCLRARDSDGDRGAARSRVCSRVCSAETTMQSTIMIMMTAVLVCRVRREMAPIWRQRMPPPSMY